MVRHNTLMNEINNIGGIMDDVKKESSRNLNESPVMSIREEPAWKIESKVLE